MSLFRTCLIVLIMCFIGNYRNVVRCFYYYYSLNICNIVSRKWISYLLSILFLFTSFYMRLVVNKPNSTSRNRPLTKQYLSFILYFYIFPHLVNITYVCSTYCSVIHTLHSFQITKQRRIRISTYTLVVKKDYKDGMYVNAVL